jgi:sugar lactone lactonase YvrE
LSVSALLIASLGFSAEFSVISGDAHYPEGPAWHLGKLYYVEYDRSTVTVWDGKSNRVFASQKGCGPSAVIPTIRGDFLTTCFDNGTIGRMSADGHPLAPYTHDRDGNRFNSPNDFAADASGGIYFSTSGTPETFKNSNVFYIAPDATITLAASDLHSANGLAVSNDGRTLYVVETEEGRVLRFQIAPKGMLNHRQVFLDLNDLTHHIEPILPDGIKIDARGRIYIGQSPHNPRAAFAGQIFVFGAGGQWRKTIHLPSVDVPNFTFSPDQKTLYVAALDQVDRSPFRGRIYAVPLQ